MSTPLRRPDDDPPGAWRRNPYLLMVVLIPLSAVLMAAVMVPLSLHSFDGTVVDDYYKRGLVIDQDLARDRQAQTLGLSGTMQVLADPARVQVHIDGLDAQAPPAPLRLALHHATRGGLDVQTIAHAHAGTGRYVAALDVALAPGRWHVQIEGDTWRLRGDLHSPAETSLRLH